MPKSKAVATARQSMKLAQRSRPYPTTPPIKSKVVPLIDISDSSDDEFNGFDKSPSPNPSPPSTPGTVASFDQPQMSMRLRSRSLSSAKKFPSVGEPDAEMVKINVIEDDEGKSFTFTVHKSFIVFYSAMFDRAFNGSFIEGTTGVMDFHDASATTFGMMLHWMYTQRIEDHLHQCEATGEDLIFLWILADKCIIPKLQNEVIHALEEANNVYDPETFSKVYENTTRKSRLRMYLADYLARSKDIELADPHEYPPEMLADMFRSARELKLSPSKKKKKKKKNGRTGRFAQMILRKYLVDE